MQYGMKMLIEKAMMACMHIVIFVYNERSTKEIKEMKRKDERRNWVNIPHDHP